MKLRVITVLLGLLSFSGVAFFMAPASRELWVILAFLCFGGILVFDLYDQIASQWMNPIIFLLIYALILSAVLEVGVEGFWRDFAGAVFLVSLLFEQNANQWTGFGALRTTLTPALIFLMLVFAQSLPSLPPEVSYGFSLAALIMASYLELFCIFREGSASNAGSFMSALRVACVGVGALFYCSVFVPNLAHQMPYNIMSVVLPGIAVLIALFSAFLNHWRRRQTLFFCNWSLFIFWEALSGEDFRLYAAIGALLGGAWTVMMTLRDEIDPENYKQLYLKLSAWGIPGSFLFTMIIFGISPSQDELLRRGSALWVLSFFIFWAGLRGFKIPKERPSARPSWSWRESLALVVTLVGASLLAGVRILPTVFSDIWIRAGGIK